MAAQLKSAKEHSAAHQKVASKSSCKLAETLKELKALSLDFKKVAHEHDELRSCAAKWLSKKKVVYRKDVATAFLKA